MASVTLSGVRKSFGSTEVVHGVDIGVDDGEHGPDIDLLAGLHR